MKYTVEKQINLPANEVMHLMMDMDFMKEWQGDGYIRCLR